MLTCRRAWRAPVRPRRYAFSIIAALLSLLAAAQFDARSRSAPTPPEARQCGAFCG